MFSKKISWFKKLYSSQETKVKYDKSKIENSQQTENKQKQKNLKNKTKM